MSSVFLSHNSKDKCFARKLGRDLRKFGIRVWLGDEEIRIGESLIDRIQAGIAKMDFLAVILSPNSVESEWVKREVDIAINQEIGNKRVKVLPLLLESCPLPPFLVGKQYADFRDANEENYRDQLKNLAERILRNESRSIPSENDDIAILRRTIGQQIAKLDLSGSQLRVLAEEELDPLTNLYELRLTGTQVRDITPLHVLKKLRVLHLGWQSAENLTAIAGLSDLQELHIYGAHVADFAPLSKLLNLRLLELVDSSCENFASLGHLLRLQSLRISIARIPDFSFLADLAAIKELSLYDTWIRDLAPIAMLKNLHALDVSREPVSSLDPISGLAFLESLHIPQTHVTNLAPLPKLPNLKSLNVAGLEITDWDLLLEFHGLRELDVCSTNIPDSVVRQLHRKFPNIRVIRGEITG